MSKSAHPQPHLGLARKPRQWPAYVSMVKYVTLAAARNRATLAFGFIFPIVFITVFGLLGNAATNVKLGIPDSVPNTNPLVGSLSQVSIVTISRGSNDELKDQLNKGKIDAVMEVETPDPAVQPPHYDVVLLTSGGNLSGAATATSVVRGVVDQANLQLSGVTNPPISFDQQQLDGRQSRYIDFALPGQIGFSLLSTAIFGTVFGFIALKKTLVLKRMFASPVKSLTILTAQGTSRLIFALIQTTLIVGVGVVAFHFYLPHGWVTFVDMLALSTIGLIAFLGFGYFMAGLANDENSAGPLVNLVTLPQFLLSGVFFSTDNFPPWIQPIANNLPLTYFNNAMRQITTEGSSLIDTWPYLLGLLAWGAVMYLLAAKTFKWE